MIERFRVTYVIDPGSPTFGTEPLPGHDVIVPLDTAGLDEQAIVAALAAHVAREHGGVATEAVPVDDAGDPIERG